ncbi:MAG: transporter substrate-binding domain-containing protein [Myxococcaceae bacterium]
MTAPIAPFVLNDQNRLTGFSIDLWTAVARRAGLEFSWALGPPLPDLLGAVQRGDADVAIAAIAITPRREELVDFSHPYLNSGLQVMVRAQDESSIIQKIQQVPWAAVGELLGASALVIFVLANILRLIERRRNPEAKGAYLPALGEALWGTMLIIATGEHGDRDAPGVLKRVTVVAMWLLGVMLIAELTATVTSAQTVQRLRSDIHGPEDLPGKVTATVPGTVAADYLTKRGLPFVAVTSANEAIERLLRGEVRAVVFAAPTLQYWVAKRGNGLLQVVGPVFEPERIGIAVADGSPLRKKINKALDELYEDGSYSEIYARWFAPAK